MKYLTTLLIACCAFGCSFAKESKTEKVRWICVNDDEFKEIKQEVKENDALVLANLNCDKDECGCEDDDSCKTR